MVGVVGWKGTEETDPGGSGVFGRLTAAAMWRKGVQRESGHAFDRGRVGSKGYDQSAKNQASSGLALLGVMSHVIISSSPYKAPSASVLVRCRRLRFVKSYNI